MTVSKPAMQSKRRAGIRFLWCREAVRPAGAIGTIISRAAVSRFVFVCLAACHVVCYPAGAQDAAQEDERAKAASQFDEMFPGRYSERLEAMLATHLAGVDQLCGLTSAQRAKLTLAGQGDIRKFWERVGVARGNYVLAWGNRDRMIAIWPNIQELFKEVDSEFFTKSSFFYRSVEGTLDPVQRQKYVEEQRKRERYHYEARLGLSIAKLERGMPLRGEQRERLIDLLVETSQPLEGVGESDVAMLLNALSQLPEHQLRSILDDVQLDALRDKWPGP